MNPLDWRLLRETHRGMEAGEEFEERLALTRVALGSLNTGVGMVFLYLLIVLFGLFFFAQYSGSVRWVLLFLLAAALAAIVMRFISVGARDPDAAKGARGLVGRRPGEVRRFAAALERAARGMRYSQIVADERLREALLNRARISRGVPSAELDAARGDPERLAAFLGDPDLARFVLESERESRTWPSVLAAMPRRPAYWSLLQERLAKAEALR
ncbi:MAG TPA: hypothetical protein VJ397_11195 [Thermoplasmata archaeon]|nr:hypothetical protein [Thermoplasmata archaeon]